MPTLSENRRTRHDFEILETYQAGIKLSGQETKSAKLGRMQISGAYVRARGDELFLIGAVIPPYQPANMPLNYDESRTRKLLLTRKELNELGSKVKQSGLTIVPTKVYNRRGLVKIEIALARPKKKWDRREIIKARETKRTIERTLKQTKFP